MEFPGLAYLTCALVYEALDQVDQTVAAVTAGYVNLMGGAERIEDDAWRRSFLHEITEHQALVERWNALVQSRSDDPDDSSAAGRISE
jgi:hypothetical protein